MNVLQMQFLDILVKGKQTTGKRGGGDEDAVCDSVIHEVQFNVNCQVISQEGYLIN